VVILNSQGHKSFVLATFISWQTGRISCPRSHKATFGFS
jgi:hypothetical protein